MFELLKRDVPPPWKEASWSDFHQEDLTSICLVSIVSMGFNVLHIPASDLARCTSEFSADCIQAVQQPSVPIL